MGVLCTFSLGFGTYFCWRPWRNQLLSTLKGLNTQLALRVLFLLVLGFQLYYVIIYQANGPDVAYYNGISSTAVVTNSMMRFSPFTGYPVDTFDIRYILSTYPIHNAFIGQVFGMNTLLQIKLVVPVLLVLLTNMLYYRIGLFLFKGKAGSGFIFCIAMFFVAIFFNSDYTTAQFFFNRTAEGKSIIANIFIAMVVYAALRLYRDPLDVQGWWSCLAVSGSGVAISSSALFIIPLAMSAAIVPLVVIKPQRLLLLIRYVIISIPAGIYLLIYMAASSGILTLPVP